MMILYNGNVITLDSFSRIVEAIRIDNGKIMDVGSSSDLLSKKEQTDELIDLKGATVTPGFFDAHPHMDREGLKEFGGIPIAGLTSIEEIMNSISKAVNRTKPGEWIILMPMGSPPLNYFSRPEELQEGRFPDRYDIDSIAPDNPVYIRAVWGWWSHRPFPSVANSNALKLAGISSDTSAPYNVEIVKDEKGKPTGLFLDYNFAPVVEYTLFKILPRFTYEQRVQGIALACAAYNATGTTSGYEGHGLTPAVMKAWREVYENGDLTVRITAPYSPPTATMTDQEMLKFLYFASGVASLRGTGDDMFRVEGIMIGNGTPEVAEIIAKEYPYEQWAGHYIQAIPAGDRFIKIGVEAAHLGLRISRSVCYDLEADLNCYEAINKEISIRDKRWVLMHLIQATKEQLKRIKDLGLVVTVEPNFMYMASDRFGIDKLRENAIPLRELIDADIPVALGSDNVPYSMLWTMWEALVRWDEDSKSRLGESGLTREETLKLSVKNGHFITWNEDRLGSVEEGKIADLVVLDDNPLECQEDDIKDIHVKLTIVNGKIAYRA